PGLPSSVAGLAIQPDGNILVGGTGGRADFAVARIVGESQTAPDQPPVPTITGAQVSSPEGTTINLGSSVVDPDSPQASLTYSWTVTKDGNAFGSTGTGSSFTFTPDDNASYVVSLSVSDGQLSGSDTKTITVTNVAPTLTVGGDPNVNEGGTYTLNLGSSDPGADTISSWTINWRDGTPAQTVTGNPGSVTHVYADSRATAYKILTSATDEDGTYAGPSKLVTVLNVAPTALISGPA